MFDCAQHRRSIVLRQMHVQCYDAGLGLFNTRFSVLLNILKSRRAIANLMKVTLLVLSVQGHSKKVDFGGVILHQQNAHWVVTTRFLVVERVECSTSILYRISVRSPIMHFRSAPAGWGPGANMAVAIAGFPREVAAGNAHDKGKTKASTSHDQGWSARSAVDSRRSWQCQHRHHAAGD